VYRVTAFIGVFLRFVGHKITAYREIRRRRYALSIGEDTYARDTSVTVSLQAN
jgi:hypothetical protein